MMNNMLQIALLKVSQVERLHWYSIIVLSEGTHFLLFPVIVYTAYCYLLCCMCDTSPLLGIRRLKISYCAVCMTLALFSEFRD